MTAAALPGAECAYVEQGKIVDYLLNPGHPIGSSKAGFFVKHGFTLGLWNCFADALIAQGRNNVVTKITTTTWGMRYQVDCRCPTPDGADPCIRTVWEIGIDGRCPRLLTAHPQ